MNLATYIRSRKLSHPRLQSFEPHGAAVCISGEGGKICCSRWVKFGVLVSIIHAGGAGGGGHSTATGRTSDLDEQPLTISSEISAQPISVFLGMCQLLVVLLFGESQAALQVSLLFLLRLQLPGRCAVDLGQGVGVHLVCRGQPGLPAPAVHQRAGGSRQRASYHQHQQANLQGGHCTASTACW